MKQQKITIKAQKKMMGHVSIQNQNRFLVARIQMRPITMKQQQMMMGVANLWKPFPAMAW